MSSDGLNDNKLKCLEVSVGASWLIKHAVERRNKSNEVISGKQSDILFSCFEYEISWQVKLHILQLIPLSTITQASKKWLEKSLRESLTDTNKFVRAWSYGGYYELARQYPEYRAEAVEFCEMAMRDESTSVKARVWAVTKKAF